MSKKIIVVEDSNVVQNLLKKILSRLNYEVESAKNGQQLIDMMSNSTYDLILLDINMPVMDGMECAKSIRAMDDAQKDVPIIAITGNAKNYTKKDFKAVGINSVVPKPLDYDFLIEQVKKFASDS
ncbi:MAG: response regulator [Ekhidna sp.]|nr:response regulator [Ekhidna sp.]